MARYRVVIEAEKKFGFGGDEITPEAANEIVENVAEKNGKIVQNFKLNGTTITAEMIDKPESEAQIRPAVFPIVAFIAWAGAVIIGVAIWNWSVTSVTELIETTGDFFDKPVVKAGIYGVIAYLAVEVFKSIPGVK